MEQREGDGRRPVVLGLKAVTVRDLRARVEVDRKCGLNAGPEKGAGLSSELARRPRAGRAAGRGHHPREAFGDAEGPGEEVVRLRGDVVDADVIGAAGVV